MYFNVASNTEKNVNNDKIAVELKEKASSLQEWALESVSGQNLFEVLESNSCPSEFKNLVDNSKEVSEVLAERGNRLLAQIDYDKLLTALDVRGSSEDSTPQMLWGWLTQDYGSLREVKFAIDSVGNVDAPAGDKLWQMNTALMRLNQLTSLSRDFLLPEPPEISANDVADATEIKSRITKLDDLIEAERSYQGIAHNSGTDKMPRYSTVLMAANYSDLWVQNPHLTNALNRHLGAKESEIRAMGIYEEDMLEVSDREVKEARIKDLVLLAPALEKVFAGEGIDTVIQALAAHDMVLEELKSNDYLVNRITRDANRLPKGKAIEKMKAELAGIYPDLTIEEARDFLNDTNHSLDMYSIFSHQVTLTQKAAIGSAPSRLDTATIYSDEDLLVRARALRYSLDNTDHDIPVVRKSKNSDKLPNFSLKVAGDEFSYLDLGMVQTGLSFAVFLGGLPIPSLCNRIILDQAVYEDDETHLRVPQVFKASEEDRLGYQYAILSRIMHSISHETGELLVARMNYRQIEGYAKVFMDAQGTDHAFVSDYSHTKYLRFPALGMKEDLCDTCAMFAEDYDSHLSLLKSSPDRYMFMVGLLSSIRDKTEQRKFIEGIAITMHFAKLDKQPEMAKTQAWSESDTVITTGQVFKERKRVKKMITEKTEVQKKTIKKESIHVYVPALQIV